MDEIEVSRYSQAVEVRRGGKSSGNLDIQSLMERTKARIDMGNSNTDAMKKQH